MNKQIYTLVWKQFNERKLRSSLTILGIVIGITALISLILLSNALKDGVTGQLESLGSDVILIAPTAALGGGGPPQGIGAFTESDVEVIRQIPQVARVNFFVSQSLPVEVGRETKRFVIRGFNIDDSDTFRAFIRQDIAQGRLITNNDVNSIVIGHRFAKEAFDRELFVGTSLRIDGRKFTIVGIFEEQGDQGSDFAVITTANAMRSLLNSPRAVTGISAQVTPGADLEVVQQRIINRLSRYRGEEDFSVTTPQEIADTIGQFLAIVDLVVLSIALVSLFVASLGIMNSLYTSVLQRTKEIGTLKAVGAKNSQILSIFLLESALMGAIGGLLGILFGVTLAWLFITGINTLGFVRLDITIDFALIIGSFVFSVVLGIFSGILPAIRASKLKPVDALRHE